MRSFSRFLWVTLVVGCSLQDVDGMTERERAHGGSNAAANGPNAGRPNGPDVLGGADGGASGAGATSEAGPPPVRPPVDTSCNLPGAAFCDPFATPSPGGRAGALDDAKWSMARLGIPTAFRRRR
jgi:hypothetical protein